MRKFAKIIGIVLLSLIGLLVVAFLLIRFAFREQAASALCSLEQQERVELLCNAGPYAADTVQYRFTYTPDSMRSREIYAYFRLDTLLRPDASTWENTLVLAKFVASNIPHANQKVYPKTCNAIALWEYHLNVEPAFNCRLHSIMLHELLLASGVTNRFITCLPNDPEDNDCHVVNVVWLPELQKWAMIDSDMQAYLTDAAGTPLSLQEMRARYIADEPLTVRGLFDDGEDTSYYRAYWAKNLYWFSCWEQSGYDLESGKGGTNRSICLTPQGFEPFKHGSTAASTTDEERFWAAPECAYSRETN